MTLDDLEVSNFLGLLRNFAFFGNLYQGCRALSFALARLSCIARVLYKHCY